MRILVFSQLLATFRSGVGTYARALVEGLSQRGHAVTAVVPSAEAVSLANVSCASVDRAALDPSPGGWLSLSQGFARELAAHAGHADLAFFTDARDAWRSTCRSLPLVGMVNDAYALDWLEPEYPRHLYADRAQRALYYRFARWVERRTYPAMTQLLANSEDVARQLISGYGIDRRRVHVVRYGLSDTAPGEAETLEGAPSILFVGGNFQRKGLPVLLQAARELVADFPSLRVHVVGRDRNQPGLERLAERLGVRAHVCFHGGQANARVLAMMAAADVFALPSWTEAFGLVYLEAMRAGTPVIATAAGGLSEVARDGDEALLVPPGDAGALAQALRRVFSQPELAQRLIEGGRALSARFTVARMIDETERLLLKLLTEASQASSTRSRGT